MTTYSLVPIILMFTFLRVISLDQCKQNNPAKCICLTFFNDDYEYQCPPNDYNILMHSKSGPELSIECQKMYTFNMDLLPNFKSEENTSVIIKDCPLPENNLINILNKFNITNILQLRLENIVLPEALTNQSISKHIFTGLSGLKDLNLAHMEQKLDDDILEFLPNLVNFDLDHSDIADISRFKFPPSLKVLHLTQNSISDIPDGIFQHLSKLYQLHLWNNRIKRIKRNAFIGLKSLISLELSINQIEDIEEDSFAELEDLRMINLGTNKLGYINSNIFKHNRNLTSIRLEGNLKLNLSEGVFANFPKLNTIRLSSSGIETLPEGIFKNTTGLKSLKLQKNQIQDLPENIFHGLTNLNDLDLSMNRINSLSDKIFSSLTSLTEINLSFNNLNEINGQLFKNMVNLETLILRNNRIKLIELNSFYSLRNLLEVDLSYNQYTMQYELDTDPFNALVKLQKINLRHNLIEEFPDWTVLLNLQEIDLSFNKLNEIPVAQFASQTFDNLTKINLYSNNIRTVNFEGVDLIVQLDTDPHNYQLPQIKVNLSSNPLTCDCGNYDLIRYLRDVMNPAVKSRVNLELGGAHCAQPEIFRHITISDLKPEHISCEFNVTGCPKECKSFWRPHKNFFVFDCSHKNLTNFPMMSNVNHSNIEMNLVGNNIRGGLNNTLGYENVKNLYLSNNKLKELKWIPLGIEKLTLDRNELTHLEPELLEILNKTSNLEMLKLSNNPWSCGCSALNLQIFIRDNYKKINSTEVICRDDNQPLLEKRELCKSSAAIILLCVLPLVSFLILTIIGLILYIYYRQEVKVWLFSKNLCLWFVSEEELDEDKVYDIFISYSHKDEEFVIQNLLPVLESGPKPFKTCIHVRDWEPGEMIMSHVTNSVLNSKRTLVILSNNFLESVWGIVEFKTAHMRALEEGRTRLVVVKYGDLDESKLDDDLKVYLNTNTYIEWGKPWFWNKLKYALPHSHKTGFYKSNQKHANVMLKIDDKFELAMPPLKHAESTPPVITLDPSLLKNHLKFDVRTESNGFSGVPLVINT
nr:Toll-like receptor 5 [Altica viridicyanea]WNA22121.1 Toll-like receptor 6 [Altica viridicyanea]